MSDKQKSIDYKNTAVEYFLVEDTTQEETKNEHNRSDKDNTKREICEYFQGSIQQGSNICKT
jgi:hypothetical protein